MSGNFFQGQMSEPSVRFISTDTEMVVLQNYNYDKSYKFKLLIGMLVTIERLKVS